ncbi:MAG: M24 family metallopeptidase C-terminal domain-containing protein [Gammaproteobacteria bacterium]|nr:M24 family metallopeptidase C-terminal domain-containing protein [Gammaproteobacteria bacterium]
MADLTLVPYARELIDLNLLSENEIKWINEYHQEIVDKLADELSSDVREWLKEATKPLK